ncbi:MAG: DNA polymerase III subunit delta [Metallibacterium sp.]
MHSASDWSRALAAPELPAVILLAGDELLVLEAADATRARARALGYGERTRFDVESGFDWNDLARAGAGLSLFATRRLLDLRLPAGKPGKDGAEAIVAWCAQPPPDTVLLISSQDWSRKHEAHWSQAIERAGVAVHLQAPRAQELPNWLGQRLAARGLAAEMEALDWLAARTEGNLLAGAQEIDKLVLLVDAGTRLDRETLEQLVSDSARYDAFQLIDAVLAGDAARALRILAGLRTEGEDLLPLLGLLNLQLGIAARLAGARDFDAAARAEHLWQARAAQFRRALARAPQARFWQRCLVWSGRIDRMVKGRESGEPWREFERLLVVLMQPRAAAALA